MVKSAIFAVLVVLLTITTVSSLATIPSYPEFDAPVIVGQLRDPRWTGISGLAASQRNPGVWWIHNDGGTGVNEAGRFYAITDDGTLLAEFTLAGVSSLGSTDAPVDIEDIAVRSGPNGESFLYLADIGGNRYTPSGRTSVRIFRVREPQVGTANEVPPPLQLTDYTTLHLTYPHGLRHDAETLLVDTNSDVYIVTKAPSTGTSRVYLKAAPHVVGTTTPLTLVATLEFWGDDLPGDRAATAGDISVRGTEAVIRTYDHVFLWVRPPGASWSSTFATTKPCTLPTAPPQVYEAVAFDHTGTDVRDTYEASSAALQRYVRKDVLHPEKICLPLIFQ